MTNTSPPKSPLLAVHHAAAYVQLSIPTLNRYRSIGGGPIYQKVGGRRVFYAQQDLDAWLASRRRRVTCEG